MTIFSRKLTYNRYKIEQRSADENKFRFRRLLHNTYVVTVIIHMVDAYLFTYVIFRCPVVPNTTFCNNFCL